MVIKYKVESCFKLNAWEITWHVLGLVHFNQNKIFWWYERLSKIKVLFLVLSSLSRCIECLENLFGVSHEETWGQNCNSVKLLTSMAIASHNCDNTDNQIHFYMGNIIFIYFTNLLKICRELEGIAWNR